MLNRGSAKSNASNSIFHTQTINEDTIKYESPNPIAQLLLSGFCKNLEQLLSTISFDKVYEAGCGDGYMTRLIRSLYEGVDINASDLSEIKIQTAIATPPHTINYSVGSIYEIDQPDSSHDLVVATEVLEHLDNPEKALLELIRVSKKYIIVSVPNEPIWCICNMLRFKYWSSFGNTPGHINHWNKKAFENFVGSYCFIKEIKSPFPWTMILCEIQNNN